jgi:uncharacterized protein YgiM (DUF1202 family)
MVSGKLRLVGALLLIAALALTAVLPALGQANPAATEEAEAPPNPNANISFPPPVYVLRGEFPIFGSANLPNMSNYFIEFRPLDGPLAVAGGQIVFFPAILPQTSAVQDDRLGSWNTTLVPDGLYELRLTVNVQGGSAVTQIIGPLRVENDPPPFAELIPGFNVGGAATPGTVPTLVVPPTNPPPLPTQPPPTQAPTEDPSPRAVVSTPNANVRGGDGTNYPIIATLTQGQQVPIVGISARGTGWFQVRLPSGQIGWMAPSVVTPAGNLANVPFVQPPPPPATPTPTPVPVTPTPANAVNFVAGNMNVAPFPPTCNQPFNVTLDVANFGNIPSTGGVVTLTDARASDGQLPVSQTVNLPNINPGQTVNIAFTLTTGVFYNELHRLTAVIDPFNQILETTKADNVRTLEYTLQQGACS